MPRYSRQRTGLVHSFRYTCLECGWDSDDRAKIRQHVRDWSHQGELIPHYIEAAWPNRIFRKREAR